MNKFLRIILTIFLFIVDGEFIAAQRGCFTICQGEPNDRYSPQTGQLQGPPGKRGPTGNTGMKGEKGEAGEFHSEAEALVSLATKYENLLNLTMKLESQLNLVAKSCLVRAAGIEDSTIIADQQLTASNSMGYYYEPQFSRLHSTTGYGWIMNKPHRVGEWLQVDLESNRRLVGVATQGHRGNSCCYTTSYKLQYKNENEQGFDTIRDDEGNVKIFNGNVDNYSVVKNNLDQHITARYVRIFPISWQGAPVFRWELFLC